MPCPLCGAANDSNAAQCAMCGTPFATGASPANPFADRTSNPFAAPQMYPPPPVNNLEENVALRLVIPIGTSGWAIASGYLGLISLICPLGFLGPFGIITGVAAIKQINKKPMLGGKVRAIIGIVLGTIGTLGFLFFVVAMISAAMS